MIPLRSWIIPIAAALVLLAIGVRARAEQPLRLVVTLNCDDIRAIIAWKGWDELERRAKAAGATPAQLEAARRCK